MEPVSRRLFLVRSSFAAAAAGLAATVPGMASALGAAESDVPAADDALSEAEAEAAASGDPLVIHVKDLTTGEMSFFSGTREVVAHDPQLATRLFRAAR